MDDTNMNLFTSFEEVTPKQWKQKIQFDLKGKEYNETVVWHSLEGIDVKPFYTSEDVAEKHVTTPTNSWKSNEVIVVSDIPKARTALRDALANGVESIAIHLSEGTDYTALFEEISFGSVPVYMYPKACKVDYILGLQGYAAATDMSGSICVDPIGHLVANGNWEQNYEQDFAKLESLLTSKATFPIALGINATVSQNAGATMVQQLAYALAHVNEYLNYFHRKGFNIPLQFICEVAVGGNYFFEIAKLKAFRTLFHTLTDLYTGEDTLYILAKPSLRNKTLYDYNVNMLRTTTECMSAALGGADLVQNLAYDAIFHEPNEFGQRIARNQLHILKHESYFDKVHNPTSGAYYIETLTDQLAEKALALFKLIEAGGGFIKQLKEHNIQRKIKESAAKEQQLFDEGKLVAIGSNRYPNPQDTMAHTVAIDPFLKQEKRKTWIEPILPKRLSEQLEKERLQTEVTNPDTK